MYFFVFLVIFYSKFNMLSKLLVRYNNFDNEYEHEFRIYDEQYIKNLVKHPLIKLKEFNIEHIKIYKSVIDIDNITYRSIKSLNNISSEYFQKKIKIATIDKYCEINENLLKSSECQINKLITKDLSIRKTIPLKYVLSLECAMEKHNMKVDNEYIRCRLTYSVNELPYDIDVNLRYYPETKLDTKLFNFSKEDVLKFKNIPNYKLCLDVEFEKHNDIGLTESYQKLKCFIANYDYIKEEYILKHSCIDLYSLPQVKTINHNDISSKNCKNYVYSKKMDGKRCIIIIDDDKIWLWTVKYGLIFYQIITQKYKLTILDCEQCDLYYIFDIYMFNGKDVTKEIYSKRLKYSQQLNLSKLKSVSVERFNNWSEIMNLSEKNIEGCDGIVVHSNTNLENTEMYKFKPLLLNTIDFKYVYKNGIYYLYLLINNHCLKHFSKSIDTIKFDDNQSLILFNTPYNISYTYIPSANIGNKLNNMIVETQYNIENNTWKPLKIRSDKIKPNNYFIGLNNVSIMLCPYKNYNIQNIINDEKIRTYIYDYLLNKINKYIQNPLIILDYMSNGKDIEDFYYLNCKKLYGIVDNNTDLINYNNEIVHLINNKPKPRILPDVKNKIFEPIYSKLIVYESKDKTINEMINLNTFVLKEINLIVLNQLNGHSISLEDPFIKSVIKLSNDDVKILYVYIGDSFNDEVYNKYSNYIIQIIDLSSINELNCNKLYNNKQIIGVLFDKYI